MNKLTFNATSKTSMIFCMSPDARISEFWTFCEKFLNISDGTVVSSFKSSIVPWVSIVEHPEKSTENHISWLKNLMLELLQRFSHQEIRSILHLFHTHNVHLHFDHLDTFEKLFHLIVQEFSTNNLERASLKWSYNVPKIIFQNIY